VIFLSAVTAEQKGEIISEGAQGLAPCGFAGNTAIASLKYIFSLIIPPAYI
jgi:hypothetical protein